MKRLALRLVGAYLLFAAIGKFVERQGAVRCGCDETCWCRKPGLSAFRWVAPFRHHSLSPDAKRAMAELAPLA
jgi:hypothetical protein